MTFPPRIDQQGGLALTNERSELVQAMDELLFEAIGHWTLPHDSGSEVRPVGPAFAEYVASGRYHHRGYTIAGGSSEVQHNIIAKQVLGL